MLNHLPSSPTVIPFDISPLTAHVNAASAAALVLGPSVYRAYCPGAALAVMDMLHEHFSPLVFAGCPRVRAYPMGRGLFVHTDTPERCDFTPPSKRGRLTSTHSCLIRLDSSSASPKTLFPHSTPDTITLQQGQALIFPHSTLHGLQMVEEPGRVVVYTPIGYANPALGSGVSTHARRDVQRIRSYIGRQSATALAWAIDISGDGRLAGRRLDLTCAVDEAAAALPILDALRVTSSPGHVISGLHAALHCCRALSNVTDTALPYLRTLALRPRTTTSPG